MRPLNLIISGFGTYCQRTQINLEQLGTKGLYLITGDTGSGKTTIFDAITYALYGSVNGHNRSVSMIRSTFATPDIPTEVELTFEYRGQIYNVKRNPEYERRSKRGDSVTKQLADATLTMPDGTVITQQSKVTAAIEELLGIDVEQFSQIVMIAQGDFQQLLMEGTERRQEIFRKIFKTDYYRDLQQRLLDQEKSLYGSCKDIQKEIAIYINQVSCDDTSTLNIELDKAKSNELVIQDELDLISKIIEEDSKTSEVLEAQISDYEKKIKELNVDISKASDISQLRDDLTQKTKAFDEIKKSIEEAETAFKKEKERTNERTAAEAELALLNAELEQYEQLNKLLEEQNDCKNQRERLEEKSKKLSEKVEECSKKKEESSQNLKSLSDAEQNFYKLSSEQKELKDLKEGFDSLEKLLEVCEEKLSEYTKLQELYLKADNAFEQADSTYKSMRKIYMDEQAGILAQTLEEGIPCPVCGSIEHPHPAAKSAVAPSKEELDKAETEAAECKQKASDLSADSAKAGADYENAGKNLFEGYKKLTKQTADEDLEILKQKILEQKECAQKELDDCTQKVALEESRVEKKKQIENELPELEKELKEANDSLQEIGVNLSAVNTRFTEKQNQANDLKAKLKYEDIEKANKAASDLNDLIEQIKEDFEKAQKNYEEKQNDSKTLEGQINQLKQQLDGVKEIDAQELQQKLETIEGLRKTASEKKGLVDTRLDKNKLALNSIKERSATLDELQKKHSYVSALSKTANGNLANGKEKIRLETYIQMTYFDRIIAHANKRLLIMSDLQYELVRKKQADNLRSQTGLELDVIDHYNGGQRSVKSLSGGEAFQASLSLALGLSDEVRLSSGGIKIDTMFVDEGFGTLDSEALQKAFKALSGITEGNRLVGIISHVDQLKDKIDRQIVVKKERTGGSTVEVMV